MLILWKVAPARLRRTGWARTFLTQMEEVLGTCIDRGHQGGDQRRRAQPGRPGRPGPAPGRAARARRCRWPTSRATTSSPASASCRTAGHPLAHLDTGPPAGRGRRRGDVGQRLSRRVRPSSRPSPAGPTWSSARRVTDASLVVGPGGLAPRLVADRLGPPGRRGGGRPRHRVRRPGHRRQLRLLHRGRRRSSTPASPSPRWPTDGSVGHHQAPGHRRRGVGRHGHRPAPLRDRRPPLRQHRRGGRLRHHPPRAGRARTGCGSPEYRGRPAPRRGQGLPQPARRVAQHDDLRAHRARHRGEGGPDPAAPWTRPSAATGQFAELDVRLIRTDKPDAPDQRPRPPPSCASRSRTPTPTGSGGASPARPPSWRWPATRGFHLTAPARRATAYGVFWPALVPRRAGRRPRWSTPTAGGWRSPHAADLTGDRRRRGARRPAPDAR